MGFDRETAKAACARKLLRRSAAVQQRRVATSKRSRPSRQLGAAGRQLLPGLSVKQVELRTGCTTRSSRSEQRVVRIRDELDAGAAAVVVRLDGDIVAVAFAEHVPRLLGLSWPSRSRCRAISRRHRFGCSKRTGFADADVVNRGVTTRSGKDFASGMLQQARVLANGASNKTDPTFEWRVRIHTHALAAVQEHALLDPIVDAELTSWASKHRMSLTHSLTRSHSLARSPTNAHGQVWACSTTSHTIPTCGQL